MSPKIEYQVTSARPASHYFQVAINILCPDPEGQLLWLPDWIPGSYMIRDFARNLSNLQVFDQQGYALTVTQLAKSTWRCAPCNGALRVCYEIYAWDLSVRGAHLDQNHGYFNGTSLFLAVGGQEQQPVEVHISAPNGCEHWQIATTLPTVSAQQNQFGLYQASNYDELIDCPVEMGCFEYCQFSVAGVSHAIAVTGVQQGDLSRLCRDLALICEQQLAFFGGPAPFEQYLFQLTVVGQGYGGLEHSNSTSLLCSRDALPKRHESTLNAEYIDLLGLCSHEYFHSWNVKRIKPVEMVNPNLQAEVHSELLWFFEGVTSYYDDLFLLRSKIINKNQWLELLAKTITRYLRTPGRMQQTVAESSFDAWTKFYKSDENTPNVVISYYIKGALIALCLDLRLRELSGHNYSLDTLMKRLWQRYLTGDDGVSEAIIRHEIQSLVGDALQDELTQWLHTTQELPWHHLLASFGVNVKLSPEKSKVNCGFGVTVKACAEGGATLTFVARNSAAERAGLSVGDTVVAINKLRVSAQNWDKQLACYQPGDVVTVFAFRRDEWFSTQCQLTAALVDQCQLTISSGDNSNLIQWLGE